MAGCAAAAALGAAPIAAPASANGADCDTSWASPTDGDWNVEANWDNGLPGVKGPNVCIEVPGTYTVHIGASEEDSSNATASAPDQSARDLELFLGGESGEQTLELTGISFWNSSNPASTYRPKTVDAQLDIGSGFIGPNGKLLLDDNRFYHAVPPDVTVSAPGGITNEGTVVADPGSGGDRTIKGSLNNHGTVSIPNRYTTSEGARSGTLDVRGCYCQDQAGTLDVSANGAVSKFDAHWSHLEADVAQLDGTLAGYLGVADPGERFRIITADRINGSFSTVALGSGVKVEYGGDFYEDHVDLVASGPPETKIDSGPTGTTADSTPTFTFSSDDPAATFECRVDAAVYLACESPLVLDELDDGPHTFEVRALHPSFNPDPTPAIRTFNVDTASCVRAHARLDRARERLARAREAHNRHRSARARAKVERARAKMHEACRNP